ncbi:MAG: chorismate mutase [Armatimonadota bacterium]|nr:chorismate mutase [Armatimonadota bacterium]MDR7451050.1 chorismate mutase [Armatimonadota bacterium]MDR7465929.1 chorismate mutase [Armatimonadota bacterium]MDR7493994.1 chorismate mutase [Armatimonadota bacterium]MDR7498444.1 chorismate mutase [Armatimonadota bacterium]
MHIRGIRGATTCAADEEEAILEATEELLRQMADANGVESDEIAAIIFTATQDLTAAFPAEAARRLRWNLVPLLSATEMAVSDPRAVPRCIRVLMLWNTPRSQEEVVHVYLRGAARLRPDLKERRV